VELLTGKSSAIRSAVALLRARFGGRAFEVVDWWRDNPDQIGIARPGQDEPGVCIITANKEDGRFDVEQGGKMYRNCVAEGLFWAVGEELGRRA
jgi:hypothetical protein